MEKDKDKDWDKFSAQEAEASLLGAILLDNEVISRISDMVSYDDFHSPRNRKIFGVILDMYIEGQAIDLVTLRDKLRQTGDGLLEYLMELEEVVPAIANAEHYAGMVRETSLRRQVFLEAQKLMKLIKTGTGGVKDTVDGHVDRLIRLVDRAGNILVKLPQAMVQAVDELESCTNRGVDVPFANLSELLGGLHKGELVVLAGRPSMGKSSFARDMVRRLTLARPETAILVFSLEESASQYAQNVLIAQARVNSHLVRTGVSEVVPVLKLSQGHFENSAVYLLDSGTVNIKQIVSRARAMKARHGLDLVVVDYLGYVQGEGQNRFEQISDVVRKLKGLARGLNIPVLALAQLNRAVEAREERRPRLSDLRESGEIEQTADVVLFIYRESYYKRDIEDDSAEMIIAKQRHGPAGVSAWFRFEREYMRFEEQSRKNWPTS